MRKTIALRVIGRNGGARPHASRVIWTGLVLGLISSGAVARADLNPWLCERADREQLVAYAVQRASDVVVAGAPTAEDPGGPLIIREVLKGNRRPGDSFRVRQISTISPLERCLLFLEEDRRGELRCSVDELNPPIIADEVCFCGSHESWPAYRERLRNAVLRLRPGALRDSSDLVVEGTVEDLSRSSGQTLFRVLAAAGSGDLPVIGSTLRVTLPARGRWTHLLEPPMEVNERAVLFLDRTEWGYALHGGLHARWRLWGNEFQVEAPYFTDLAIANQRLKRILVKAPAAEFRALLGLPASM